jgi:hypothetical protein
MAKEKKSSNKLCGIGLFILAVILFAVPFLMTDMVINRGYLAGKDFKKAFNARITGNCDRFMEHVAVDKDAWREKCDNEKTLHTDPFYDFNIRKITVNGDRAFIQCEMTRVGQKYPVTYEMILKGGRWMINQESAR